MQTTVAEKWPGYELLDSGNLYRLERFGGVVVAKPDPTAIWDQTLTEKEWDVAEAFYANKQWEAPEYLQKDGWVISYENLRFQLALTPFRHVGVFPEQSANWDWAKKLVRKDSRVLNLFAYTGLASSVLAAAGAQVTHVDSSKGSVAWAAENAKLNGLEARWIVDDVRKFVSREVKRGAKYDLIMMDPPVFGRGAKGEVWRLEDDLPGLLEDTAQLLSDKPLGFLLNFYATDIYPEAILRVVEQKLAKSNLSFELSSLCLRENSSKKLLQTGYFVRGVATS